MRFAFWPPVYAFSSDFGLKSEEDQEEQTNVLLGPQLTLAVKNPENSGTSKSKKLR